MLILNFTHPLTDEHRAQIETLAATVIDEIRVIPVQIDRNHDSGRNPGGSSFPLWPGTTAP